MNCATHFLGQLPLLKCYLATRKKPENISTKLQKSVDPTSKVTSTSSTKTKTTATSNELNAAGPSFAEVDFIGCEPTELTKPGNNFFNIRIYIY